MDDSADKGFDGKGLGDGENAENKAVKSDAAEGVAPDHKLPVVWSPKLDAADDIEHDIDFVEVPFGLGDEPPPHEEIPASEAAADNSASSSRSSRFVLLAACVSIAAAIGSFAATLTAVGVGHVNTASVPAPDPSTSTADASSVAKALKAQIAQLNAMKSSLDSATHNANAQLNAISERLEKVEHAQSDPAQLAHIAESVDRLSKSNTATPAAPETTGSITPPVQSATATPSAPAEPKITDRILEDWVLEDVHGERALVASRYGGEFLVMPGSVLPGAGHVDAVKRQDGQWVVVTARGLITAGR
jgi:hypothetical protein